MEVEVREKDVSHTVELEEDARVEDALEKADINRETVLVEKDGQVVSSQEELQDGDKLKTMLVVSMG